MVTRVEWLTEFTGNDMDELCRAAEEAIIDGNGFGWLAPPPRRVLENYWHGVLLVPERELLVARLDSAIVGSAQFVRPPANNQARSFAAAVNSFFIAPWARGHGLARGLLEACEALARQQGFRPLELDVRETQQPAVALIEAAGYERWAVKEKYALVDGKYIAGWYYGKDVEPDK